MNVEKIVSLIVGIGALLVLGLICSFFVILNSHKKEIWEEIYDKHIRGDKNDR